MGFFGGKRERTQPAPGASRRAPAPAPAPRPGTGRATAAPRPEKEEKTGITVLIRGGTLDPQRLLDAVRTLTGDAAAQLAGSGSTELGAALPPTVDASGSTFTVTSQGVEILCAQINAPTPGLDEMIQFTRRDNAELAHLKQHGSHVLCWATGRSGIDQTIVLFQIALAMKGQGAIGFIHVPGWQCFTLDQVEAMLAPEHAEALRGEMAKAVFCNLIPFHGQGGTWWATKGNHVFGIPDFALWNEGQMKQPEVYNLFLYLFDYLRQGARLKHGETLNLPGHVLRIGPVTEYHDYIAGKGETFAFRFT
jgi:hypothetical protein